MFLLIDSFYYMKRPNKKQDKYLPRLLEKIRQQTGLTMMAVCSGGGALHDVGRYSARFDELLARVPDNLRVIVGVICGNDWYAKKNIKPLDNSVKTAAAELCEAMKMKSQNQLAVVGMSAATWCYDGWMSAVDQQQYDMNAADLVGVFRSHGVCAVRGVDELQDIKVADGIGHVSTDSESVVFEAYSKWLQLCLARPRDDARMPPAPLPPCSPSEAEDVKPKIDWTRLLGDGSFGEVFRGTLADGRICAVKVAIEEENAQMIREEGDVGKVFAHENVLKVFDVFMACGRQCVALELCDLGDMETLISLHKCGLEKYKFRFDEVVLFARQMLSAVEHVHDLGFMHRDIKPANILLCDDRSGSPVVKLADFGLAARSDNGWLNEYAGTRDYMSPEQLTDWCHPCCDVWAVGAVVYELLCLDMLIPDDVHNDDMVEQAVSRSCARSVVGVAWVDDRRNSSA